MSPEESQLLKSLFDRVKTAQSTPRDPEAETLISEALREQPSSPYYLAQAVIVQEKGLEAAAAHIKQLEERVHELEARAGDQAQGAERGGFLGSIFGSSREQAPAPQPQRYAPRNDTAGQGAGPWGQAAAPAAQMSAQPAPQQPSGPWNSGQSQDFGRSGGGSFLQGALGTAAGVAGGMLLANSLSGIFSNHMASSGLGSALGGTNPLGNAPVEETVINNYYGDDAAPKDAATDNDGYDAGNTDDDLQQADYDDGGDSMDFGSGDDSSFV